MKHENLCTVANLPDGNSVDKTKFFHFYEIETEHTLKKVNAATSGFNSLPKKLGWSY